MSEKETELEKATESGRISEAETSPHRIKQGNIEKQQKQPFLLS